MQSAVDLDKAVSVRGLYKAYGETPALKGIDLDIEHGMIFALLGPNGAGKTTAIEILEGYRERDRGSVLVLGLDPSLARKALKERIGIVLQQTGVERYLTVAETLSMYASYYPHPRPVDEVMELCGLDDKRDARVRQLSGGQQRRLDVAIALAGDPELLFLDEPTTGFDPSARRSAWEVVKNLASLGKTILLTTHYMDEAQYLADEVAVIADGHIVARGTPGTLAGRNQMQARLSWKDPLGRRPPEHFGRCRADGDRLELVPEDLTVALHELTGWALSNAVTLQDLEIERPSLEDVYLALVGEQDEAAAVEVR